MRVPTMGGIPWPPPLDAYDYLRSLTRRDWAWEMLRRNQTYQRHAQACAAHDVVRDHLGSGALITRMRGAQPSAEAWALCCFRRPGVAGA
jgi:hypothetical protein